MKKRNKKILITSSLSTLAIASSVLTLNYFNHQTQNYYNNKTQKHLLLKNNFTNSMISYVRKNIDLINLANSHSKKAQDAWKYFEKLLPTELSDIHTNTTTLQYIISKLINYNDPYDPFIDWNAIFWNVNDNFNNFYNEYSPLSSKDLDGKISFYYESEKNPFAKVANGVATFSAKIGNAIRNKFDFGNGKFEEDFSFSNMKKQFDIYLRTQALAKDEWNSSNVSDDSIVDPFKIKINGQKTLIDDNLTNNSEIKDFFINNLIQFENNNDGSNNIKIEQDSNTNAILATNLSRQDFLDNNIIQNFVATPFVGSGKIKIEITFDTSGNLINNEQRNIWLNNKKKSLTDSRGSFEQLEINKYVTKTFWLGGWEKDYSFDKLIDSVSNGSSLNAEEIGLTQTKARTIQELVLVNKTDEILNHIIQFNAFQITDNNFNKKLMTTNLSFDEFKTLIKSYPIDFGKNIQANKNAIDAFNGIYYGSLKVDPKLMTMYFKKLINSNYSKFNNKEVELIFNIKNLLKEIYFVPNKYKTDTNGYIKLEELNNISIDDFFGENNLNNIDLIKEKILTNFVSYNYQDNQFNEIDFKNNLILTNAKSFNDLNSITSIDRNSINFNKIKGEIELNILFNVKESYFNGTLLSDLNPKKINLKISGFKKDTSSLKFNFNISQNTVINLKDFNKNSNYPINSIYSIDSKWIINNLINYNNQTNTLPNLPYVFSTDASKEQFEELILFKDEINPDGIDIKYSSDFSYMDVAIHLNANKLNNIPILNNNIFTYHFRFQGFDPIFKYEYKDKFNINDAINFSTKLEDLNRDTILNNLFKYEDNNLTNFVFKTNYSKEKYFNNIFQNIVIDKNYSKNIATITLFHIDGKINFELNNFNSQIKIDIVNNLNLQYDNISLSQINNDFIINNLMNFNNVITNENSILNTNISKKEMTNNVLEYINIISKDYISNSLKIRLTFFEDVNNQKEHILTIYFNKNLINIFNINNQFSINKDNINPNDFNHKDIFKYISFNNSLPFSESIFSVNISEEEFNNILDKNNFVFEPNIKNGSIKFIFNFLPNNNIYIEDDENGKATFFSINVFGFKSNAEVNFQSKINANTYSIFNNITSINQINDKSFVIDNLIGYDGKNGIIGTTNLSKNNFKEMVNVIPRVERESLFLDFTFKSNVNNNQKLISVEINNLAFLDEKSKVDFPFLSIILISSIILIGLIIFIIWKIRNVIKKKEMKEIYEATINNKIK